MTKPKQTVYVGGYIPQKLMLRLGKVICRKVSESPESKAPTVTDLLTWGLELLAESHERKGVK